MRYEQIASGFAAFVTLTSVVTIAPIVAAQTAQLNEWQFDPVANQLKVTLPDGTKPRYFLLAQPARIVLELPNTELGNAKTQQTYSGAVREIRVSQFQPGLTRFVLELAPQAKLAPGQVQLEQLSGNSKSGQQWALRPLLANAVSQPTQPSKEQATAPTAAPTQPPTPSAVDLAELPKPEASTAQPNSASPDPQKVTVPVSPTIASAVTLAENDRPQSPPQSKPTPAALSPTPSSATASIDKQAEEAQAALPTMPPAAGMATPLPPDQLPSVPPTATTSPSELPSDPKTTTAANTSTNPVPPPVTPPIALTVPTPEVPSVAPSPKPPTPAKVEKDSKRESTAETPPQATAANVAVSTPTTDKPLQLSQANPSLEIPGTLPPATFSGDQSPTVTVPPLNSSSPPASQGIPPVSSPLPPTDFPAPASGTVSVPPLQRNPGTLPPAGLPPERPTIRQAAPTTAETGVIEFGQPLPTRSRSSAPSNYAYNPSPSVLLPTGSFLDLSYSGDRPLNVAGESKQEVLVLQTEIRDWQGNLIAPIGTAVIGRFESGISGNRFVAQAIALGTRNLPLSAESGSLGGNRQVSQNRLFLNSGIGALAGAIIGGFSGLDAVGGAAAGAAVTYVTTPKNATIQPGQVLQVRLTEDLRME